MFNSPLLDITIGLVFIFLLYSLLVTSINEAIATSLSLRASMLKKAIVGGMLSNTSKDSRWISLAKGIWSFFVGLMHWEKNPSKNAQKIGDKFFDHPLIKNYGSSRLFPLPSYIPTTNFSTVLLDVLKQDFDSKVEIIADYKSKSSSATDNPENVEQNLRNASDTIKIKELLEYYGYHYFIKKANPTISIIDKDKCLIDEDTFQILQMHLRNSIYDLKQFECKIEGWFDDSMNRVSGWYKRQTQLNLFIIGFVIAVIFNVDTIEIAGKLSTDKDARDKLVQLATEAVDKYKDDPRVKKIVTSNGTEVLATDKVSQHYNDSIFRIYQAKVESVKSQLNEDVKKTNTIIAAGWGDYGGKKTDFGRIDYVLSSSFGSLRKILGFLILAFAVSLGSPFWFDLLNKLVKLRGSGKKEDNGGNATEAKSSQAPVPVTVNINPQSTGEEAAG
jgi:hypothetical protein